MVIQRWQSVLLLIGAVCMAFTCFTPITSINGAEIYPITFVAYFTLCALCALLSLVAIFMYKNMRRQTTITVVTTLLIFAALIVRFLVVQFAVEGTNQTLLGALLPLCGLIADYVAYTRIKADQKLLRAADRLR